MFCFHYQSLTLNSPEKCSRPKTQQKLFPGVSGFTANRGSSKGCAHKITTGRDMDRISLPKFHESKSPCGYPIKGHNVAFEQGLEFSDDRICTDRLMPKKETSGDHHRARAQVNYSS